MQSNSTSESKAMRIQVQIPDQKQGKENLIQSMRSERHHGRFATLAMGALFMIAPVLMGAEGCDDLSGSGSVCGGLVGAQCQANEFCHFSPEAQCGAADQTGTCESTPEACTRIYDPVCGCDNNTYGNACDAHSAGVSVASVGECSEDPVDPEPTSGDCGGIAGLTCEEGEFCHFSLETRCGSGDQMGTCAVPPNACTFIFEPVCGCDGKTYSNECGARSNGVSIAAEGACKDEEPRTVCGGLVGSLCEKDEFCSFTPEAMCGAGDRSGVCAKKPEACTQQYDPVCGCDGNTYGNACTAASSGVSVASAGECATE